MQKYLYIIVLSLLTLACGSGTKNRSAENNILTVTIEPQRFFLEQIVGDAFTVNTLVPPGTSPETYEPAPSVMIEMGKSSIYFMVGDLGFENVWSKRLAENNPDIIIVNCSNGIDLMDGHDHSHDHDHTHHSAEHAHAHSGVDPHVWSSPSEAKIFTRNMLDAMINLHPENADKYRAGYDALTVKIAQTDSLIRSTLANASSKSFIIYHPALAYFARDYGLHQYSIEFEGKNPSPAQIKELVDISREEKINTVLIQRGFDTKNATVVAQEIGAEVFEIDPLSYNWDEELLRIAAILAR